MVRTHRAATSERAAPPPPQVCLSLGVTGHRANNPTFAANRPRIEATLARILDLVGAAIAAEPPALGPQSVGRPRVHSMLADGVDQIFAEAALARGWDLISPLPMGRALYGAINARPGGLGDAQALLAGRDAADPATQGRAQVIRALADQARVFELADQDQAIAPLFLATVTAPADLAAAQRFAAESSERVALATRLVIEQSDIVLAVWDGLSTAYAGGTGHTIAVALDLGASVVWLDPAAPEDWRILRAPESLASLETAPPPADERSADLQTLVRDVLRPRPGPKTGGRRRKSDQIGARSLDKERLRRRSNPLWHTYRRIEVLFGADTFAGRFRSLRQTYEAPGAIAGGGGAAMLACARAMPGQSPVFEADLERLVLRRFAWFDGVSSSLSDTYRGGMMASFLLASLAIIGGVAYLPLSLNADRWIFELWEFTLLIGIVAITGLGQRRRWHARWFQTRRVAEYFRHASILLLLGVARPPGRWPRGVDAAWPEWYARHALREVGLPPLAVTTDYLRIALGDLLDDHVVNQRDYHVGKAARLAMAHDNLDRCSGLLFILAMLTVAGYLALEAGGALGLWPAGLAGRLSNVFTFFGVLLPTAGGAVAGVRYFGDFERFSAISEITAEKLDAVHGRIRLLLSGSDGAIDYGQVAELAHAADEIVVAEIENWQAVFGGKHITVPA